MPVGGGTRIDHRHRHVERLGEVRAGTVAERVAYPIRVRTVEVVRTRSVGSGLIRLTLGGRGVAGFEAHTPDEHVKLIFPDPDGTIRLPEQDGLMLRWPRPSPTSREYTVRGYYPDSGVLDIDVALHDRGLVADWVRRAKPGEPVHVAGPPGGVIVPPAYDWYLLAGDITALPAIARWLEELPPTARGWAVIEVADATEQIELGAPAGFDLRWLHRGGHPPGTSDVLEQAVRSLPLPAGAGERPYVWMAGEAGTLKPLRRWVRGELGLDRGDYDITGYWKRGVADYDDDADTDSDVGQAEVHAH